MTNVSFVIGVDPGPSTGIAVLNLTMIPGRKGWADIYQCNAATAPWLLHQLCGRNGIGGARTRAGLEAFAPGRGAGGTGRPGRVTRDQVAELAAILAEYGIPCSARNAARVKPWATDARLAACGLLGLTPGSTHARDAARHALYCAHWDCGWPDPLSKAGAG